MKKIIIAVLICLFAALTLASCGKKTEATKNVEAMINGLADVQIGIDSEEAIAEIESAYNALSDEEKERVKNYDKLTDAKEEFSSVQTRYQGYEDMNSSINDIVDAAQSGFSSADINYSELMSQAQEVLDKYEELDDEGKANVKLGDEFKEAMESISAYVSTTEESAAEYVKAFNAVYEDKNYEVTGVYVIMQIRDTVEYHIFALTYKDENGEEHNLYANARCSSNTNSETIIANADAFFCQKAVSDDYNAIVNGNVALDLEAVLELAK